MRRLLIVFFLTHIAKDVSPWSMSIDPEIGHIRVNKTTTIMCQTTSPIQDCKFKIDSRKTMEFGGGPATPGIVVINKGKQLYTAYYSGKGLRHGQCGIRLSNVVAGVYVVGCQLQDMQGSMRQEFMTLTVSNDQPLRVNVNSKYMIAAPGTDVEILCTTEKKQQLDNCAMRLPSTQWVHLKQGHQSLETDRYHYHGRGLDKGHCGIRLLNVTHADSGLVLCHVQAGSRSAVRAIMLKVAELHPETEMIGNKTPHLAPGDTLEAECVMKGAYPLPKMIWSFGPKILQRSDVDQTPEGESEFRWQWEDHIIRQTLSVPVGNKLGIVTLKCNAAETAEELVSPVIAKSLLPDNEINVHVHPKCGIRTSSTYDMAYKVKPISGRGSKPTTWRLPRSVNKASGTEVVVDEDEAPITTIDSNKTASTTTTPKGAASGDNSDYVEPIWDEDREEPVTVKYPVAEEIDEMMFSPPVSGMVGGISVLGPTYLPMPMPLPPPPPTVKVPPGPITGGNSVLGNGNVVSQKPRNFTAGGPGGYAAGARDVLDIPFLDTTPTDSSEGERLQSAGGIETLTGVGWSTGGTKVIKPTEKKIDFETYPWTAGVYKNIKGKYTQQCGGTLVTDTHVICAAHCFWNEQASKPLPPQDYRIALGKVFRDWDKVDGMVQKRSVRQLHLHPVFRGRKRNFQHDISVIELMKSVDFTPRVAPACLDWDNDFEEEQLTDNSIGVVTGWGYTEDERPSEVLRYVELPFVDLNTCYDKLPEDMHLLLTTDKFCAGFTNRNTSVCPGDSGGGLLIKNSKYNAYFLRGVVSVSFRPPSFRGNCYYSEVTGFTMVSQSLPWLKRILNFN